MRLSAPVYRLKRKARLMSRAGSIPLHEALDHVAAEEGVHRWSLLSAKAQAPADSAELFALLAPGDLVLVGARPRQGKTLMSLRLAVEAMRSGHRSAFFTLDYTERDVIDRFRAIGAELDQFKALFDVDYSDAISAAYIADRLSDARPGTLAVVDYLQILDQDRQKPELTVQVRTLKSLARERGLIILCISQIDRSYDPSSKQWPDFADVRLPNPLDLTLFDKAFFLNNGEVSLRAAS
jgi:replicative DNA helicase